MTKEAMYGLISYAALGVTGFVLVWAFNMNAEIKVLQDRMAQHETGQSADGKTRDDGQDRQLRMQWKYNKWLHWQVNQVRFKTGMDPANDPDLGD